MKWFIFKVFCQFPWLFKNFHFILKFVYYIIMITKAMLNNQVDVALKCVLFDDLRTSACSYPKNLENLHLFLEKIILMIWPNSLLIWLIGAFTFNFFYLSYHVFGDMARLLNAPNIISVNFFTYSYHFFENLIYILKFKRRFFMQL